MHVLLTGASSGIGAALARHCGAAGMKVSLVARSKDKLEKLAAEIADAGGEAAVFARDLTDLAAVDRLAAEAAEALGPIDVLVNNAGMDIIERYTETDVDAAARLLTLNLHAPLRLTRSVLPGMLERHSGTIVDVSSVASFTLQPYGTHYTASKAALAAADRQLRWELRGTGVRVLTVYPGPIETPMGDLGQRAYKGDLKTSGLPWGNVDTLAEKILRAIDLGHSELVYPPIYRVVKWFPWTVDWFGRFVNIELSPLR